MADSASVPHWTAAHAAVPAAAEKWHAIQILVLALCFVINALDGMDILIMSYVAPALAKDWAINPATLGVVFSAGLAGMMFGSIVVAPLADRFGRRTMILAALTAMALAMIGSGLAQSVALLMVARFVVGIAIGTVLASMAALTAEYAPERHRTLAVSPLQGGYLLSAVATGLVCVHAIPAFGWQPVLLGAGLLSAVALPIVLVLLPESLEFIVRRQPARALERANRILARLDRPALSALPPRAEAAGVRAGIGALLTRERLPSTLLA